MASQDGRSSARQAMPRLNRPCVGVCDVLARRKVSGGRKHRTRTETAIAAGAASDLDNKGLDRGRDGNKSTTAGEEPCLVRKDNFADAFLKTISPSLTCVCDSHS